MVATGKFFAMCLLRKAAVLYQTDLFKADVERLRFSNILDKFIAIDPKAPN